MNKIRALIVLLVGSVLIGTITGLLLPQPVSLWTSLILSFSWGILFARYENKILAFLRI